MDPTEVISNDEDAGADLERLKRRLEALEEREREREAVDGREDNMREISRVRVKDVDEQIFKSTEVKAYRRWKKNLLWWSECTEIPFESWLCMSL